MSEKVGGLPSWLVQLESPGTALTVGGSGLGVKTSVVGRGCFDTTPSVSSSVQYLPSQLNQASAENDYHDNCRTQWKVQTVTKSHNRTIMALDSHPLSWVGRVKVLVPRMLLA